MSHDNRTGPMTDAELLDYCVRSELDWTVLTGGLDDSISDVIDPEVLREYCASAGEASAVFVALIVTLEGGGSKEHQAQVLRDSLAAIFAGAFNLGARFQKEKSARGPA